MDIESKKCFAAALRLLGMKGRFEKELTKKLQLKGFSAASIQQAIEECKRLGYLNEKEEKRLLIQREARKGKGPKLIALKLRERGGTGAIHIDQDAHIAKLLQTRYQKYDLADIKQKHKVFCALQRRGFDEESILRAINKI